MKENKWKREAPPAPAQAHQARIQPPEPAEPEAGLGVKVSIAEEVIRAIALIAASEIEGLEGLEPHPGKGSVAEKVGMGIGVGFLSGRSRGVEAEVSDDNTVRVNLKVAARYGQPLHELARRVQERVKRDIEEMTGLQVSEVNVHIQEIHLPSVPPKVEGGGKEGGEGRREREGEGR